MRALACHNVSSATEPITQLSAALRTMYNKPVAQPCANGFTALLLALQCHGITKDSLVLVPTFTMVAVPNAVVFLGGTPVFADNAPGAYNPGVAEYLAASAKVDKAHIQAVITSHTYAVPSDLKGIKAMCKQNGWALIEDISEAIGGKYGGSYLGSYGDYGCASMYANKALTSGDGGFIVCDDPRAAKRLSSIVNHGFTPRYHFLHPESCVNGKMSGIAAALALPAVGEIDEIMRHRTFMAKCYRQYLEPYAENVLCMPVAGDEDTPWVFGIEVKTRKIRDELRSYLAGKCGVETRNYFVCLHDQGAWARGGVTQNELFPNAFQLAETGFYLPSHYWLTSEDIQEICKAVGSFFKNAIPDLKSAQHQLKPTVIVNFKGSLESVGPQYLSAEDHDIAVDAVWDLMGVKEFFDSGRENWSNCVTLHKSLLSKKDSPSLTHEVRRQVTFYAGFLCTLLESNHILPVPICQSPWEGFEVPACTAPTPTTSTQSLQQILCWLVTEYKCKFVVEMGAWLGGTTIPLLKTLRKTSVDEHHLLVVDGFRWQEWMNRYIYPSMRRGAGKPFYQLFQRFLQKNCGVTNDLTAFCASTSDFIGVDWEKSFPSMPRVDLAYLDLTTEFEEMEEIINFLEPRLADNALIVVNMYGISPGVCKFVEAHAQNLQPLYKPSGYCKVFTWRKVVPSNPVASVKKELPRKVHFASSPDWDHHRKGSFCDLIEYARSRLHNGNAAVKFVPALESYLCDQDFLPITSQWMGMLHQPEHCALPWVMDLDRLMRSPQFLASLPLCLGLYTLSSHMRDYVASHLPAGCTVPVCRLFYALSAPIPAPVESKPAIRLALVGEFMRNFEDFLQLPSNALPKVWLVGVSQMASPERLQAAVAAGVNIQGRLDDEKYQAFLTESVVFLSLSTDGIVSTLLIECICSNTPVLFRKTAVGCEYLGEDYPLFFDTLEQAGEILTSEKIETARAYLRAMDKRRFSPEHFVKTLAQSSPYLLAPVRSAVDVTVCLISYKRTHNISAILHALLFQQDPNISLEVFLWNNNYDRRAAIDNICSAYPAIHVIHSGTNFYCMPRVALAGIMHSNKLLICDDDALPHPKFVATFLNASEQLGSRAVLCLHGHTFLPHRLDPENPASAWEYGTGYARFVSDNAAPQHLHFAHADGCLLSKQALLDVASIEMPNKAFALVDDLWFSFVLSHYFNYPIYKIQTTTPLYSKMEGADDPLVAMHLNPDVCDARIQLYSHFMSMGWPRFPTPSVTLPIMHEEKMVVWDTPFVGYNIPSTLTIQDMKALRAQGVRVVRLGAVCMSIGSDKENYYSDLGYLSVQCMGKTVPSAMQRLAQYIEQLGQHSLKVILTLHRSLATPSMWAQISQAFASNPHLVGYDLINEPHFSTDLCHSTQDFDQFVRTEETKEFTNYYIDMIRQIRVHDTATPIILESPFWSFWRALKFVGILNFLVNSRGAEGL